MTEYDKKKVTLTAAIGREIEAILHENKVNDKDVETIMSYVRLLIHNHEHVLLVNSLIENDIRKYARTLKAMRGP